MRVLILITFVASALGASTTIFTTTTDVESTEASVQQDCEEGECVSIKDCLNSDDGVIQDSSLCTCPDVYCCYSQLSTTEGATETTTASTLMPSSSSVASSTSTSSSTSSSEASTSTLSSSETYTPSVEVSVEETTTPGAEEPSPTTASVSVEPISEEPRSVPEGDCSPWSCSTEEECDVLNGVEGTNMDNCPEPYIKCCLSFD